MTGAGTAELVFGHEDTFKGSLVDGDSDGDPDLYEVGRDPTITELDLQNQLEDMRDPDSVWSVESVKQNFEGAVGVEATVSSDVHGEVEKIVFNDGTGSQIVSGLANSARLFVGVDYFSGTTNRVLIGCIPTEYSITYEQGGMVTFSLTMLYADEESSTSVDLTTATRVSDDTSVPFHGFQLDIDGTTVSKLQSATLSIADIARFQRGTSPTPEAAVIAAPSATLEAEAIYSGPSRLDIARGNATGTLPDSVGGVSGTITLNANGTTVSTYNLSGLSPDTYSWNQVLQTEDTTETIQFNITDENAVSVA